MGWMRNDHQYLGEPLEFRRLRLRDRAEDPRPGIDIHDDPADRHDPATDQWPTSLRRAIPSPHSAQGSVVGSLLPTVPVPAGSRHQPQRAARPGTGKDT